MNYIICGKSFTRRDSMERHVNTLHRNFVCGICREGVDTCEHVAGPPKKRVKVDVAPPTSSNGPVDAF